MQSTSRRRIPGVKTFRQPTTKISNMINPLWAHYNSKATDHTAIRWLVHWPLMGGLLHLVQRGGGLGGLRACGPAQSPLRCTKCNSPPINGQCTNFILCDVASAVYMVQYDETSWLLKGDGDENWMPKTGLRSTSVLLPLAAASDTRWLVN